MSRIAYILKLFFLLPPPQDQKLQASKILRTAKALIEERLKGQQYDPVKGAQVRSRAGNSKASAARVLRLY